MKRNHALRRMMALVFSLLLLITASAALAAELENGVTWDTTVQEMLAIEGVPEGEEHEGAVVGEFLNHGFLHFADGPQVRFMLYIYKADRLALYGASISAYFLDEGTVMTEIFSERLAALTETYGAPALADPQRCLDAFNAVEADSLKPEDIVLYAGWELDGGTALHLVNLKNEFDDNVYTLYVNEALLFAKSE